MRKAIADWSGYTISETGLVHDQEGRLVQRVGRELNRVRLKDARGVRTRKLSEIYQEAFGEQWPEPMEGGIVVTVAEWIAMQSPLCDPRSTR